MVHLSPLSTLLLHQISWTPSTTPVQRVLVDLLLSTSVSWVPKVTRTERWESRRHTLKGSWDTVTSVDGLGQRPCSLDGHSHGTSSPSDLSFPLPLVPPSPLLHSGFFFLSFTSSTSLCLLPSPPSPVLILLPGHYTQKERRGRVHTGTEGPTLHGQRTGDGLAGRDGFTSVDGSGRRARGSRGVERER